MILAGHSNMMVRMACLMSNIIRILTLPHFLTYLVHVVDDILLRSPSGLLCRASHALLELLESEPVRVHEHDIVALFNEENLIALFKSELPSDFNRDCNLTFDGQLSYIYHDYLHCKGILTCITSLAYYTPLRVIKQDSEV